MSRHYRLFIYVFLSALSGFGPLVTDMYLPALPMMAESFQTVPVMVQLSLTASMVGLAAGQIVIGPLSDKYGRTFPLRISLILFLVSTAGCVAAWDISSFLFFRVVQGLAGAGGIVLSRSIITDLFSGHELTKAFGIVMAMNSLAPMLSPVCGSLLLEWWDWRGIFVFLLGLGAILMLLSWKFRESLPAERRLNASPAAALAQFGPLFRNRRFLMYGLVQGAAFGIVFAYISSSPYVLQIHYGQSPFMFGIWFAFNALAMVASSVVLPRFRKTKTALRTGGTFGVLMTACTAAVLLAGGPFWLFEGCLLLTLFFLCLLMTASTILAMNTEKQRAGTASAFLGAALFAVGGLVSPLVGMGNACRSTAVVFLGAALAVALLMTVIHYWPYYVRARRRR